MFVFGGGVTMTSPSSFVGFVLDVEEVVGGLVSSRVGPVDGLALDDASASLGDAVGGAVDGEEDGGASDPVAEGR